VEHLGGDRLVGLPAVADLPRAVLRVAPRDPVDLVGLDAGLVVAVEEPLVSLAETLERAVGDQAFLDDQEAVVLEGRDLLGGERVDRQERGLVFSGS
jgi:hypothetical protein